MGIGAGRTNGGVRIYDRDGRRIDLDLFLSLEKDEAYRRVGLDDVDGIFVSTIWIGVDAGTDEGSSLIFETIVVGPDSRAERTLYPTLSAARSGHEGIVARLRHMASSR